MPSPPASSPASAAFWNSPLWNSAQASSTARSLGRGSASPACSLAQCFFTLAASNGYSPTWGKAVHFAMPVSFSLSARRVAVCRDQPQQVHALALLQVGYQQVEHMMRAAQQGELGALGLQRPPRIAHVFVA